jgi:transcriptional regulator with XRE-family HTH domain
MRIGKLIRRLRIKAEMTQEELALAVDTTQGSVSQWESGTHEPSVRNLIVLAEALGVDLIVLVDAFSEDDSDVMT